MSTKLEVYHLASYKKTDFYHLSDYIWFLAGVFRKKYIDGKIGNLGWNTFLKISKVNNKNISTFVNKVYYEVYNYVCLWRIWTYHKKYSLSRQSLILQHLYKYFTTESKCCFAQVMSHFLFLWEMVNFYKVVNYIRDQCLIRRVLTDKDSFWKGYSLKLCQYRKEHVEADEDTRHIFRLSFHNTVLEKVFFYEFISSFEN